jgi:hypothetical protein
MCPEDPLPARRAQDIGEETPMNRTFIRRFGLALVILAVAGAGFAAQRAPGPRPIPTSPVETITLGPASFQVQGCEWQNAYLDYDVGFEGTTSFRVKEGYPSVSLAAPVHLPQGAIVTGVVVNYFDMDPDTEPSMGLYAIGEGGRPTLIVDASGLAGFSNGETSVHYKVDPVPALAGAPYEFLVTLNRSVVEPKIEHALFRVQINYRIALDGTKR